MHRVWRHRHNESDSCNAVGRLLITLINLELFSDKVVITHSDVHSFDKRFSAKTVFLSGEQLSLGV